MTVGDRIKQTREKMGISQIELATKIQTSKQTIYKYENNIITNIPYDKLISISKILDVTPSYLMGWEKPSVNDAEILADLAGNKRILEYANKLNMMNEETLQMAMNYIDYLLSNKKN